MKMYIKHFIDCKTLEELKQAYRKLTKKYHPDCGGTNDLMRELNTEFDYLKVNLKSHHKEDWKVEQEFKSMDEYREKLLKVIHLPDIMVEVIGDWIWVSGETKEYKDYLGKNGAGYSFSGQKKAWYWKPYKWRKRSSGKSMDYIREKYGSTQYQNQPHTQLT